MTCRSTSDPLNAPFTEQPENIYINFKKNKMFHYVIQTMGSNEESPAPAS